MQLENVNARPEICAAKENGRYAMHVLNLRTRSERWPGKGELAATDGRKLVVLPVDVEPHDTDGFIAPEALKAARKAGKSSRGRRGADVLRIVANGAQAIYDRPSTALPERPQHPGLVARGVGGVNLGEVVPASGPMLPAEPDTTVPVLTMPRPSGDGLEFPRLDAVIPAPLSDKKRTTVGLNADFLAELQSALGSQSVFLSFQRKPDGSIDEKAPILVTRGRTREHGVGVLMPVTIDE